MSEEICDACGKDLLEPGATVLSPPIDGHVSTYYLCKPCFSFHSVVFSDERFTIEHSFACKLTGRMAECEYHAAIERLDPHERQRGRWFIEGLSLSGQPILRADA